MEIEGSTTEINQFVCSLITQGQRRSKNDAPRIYRSTCKKAAGVKWEGKGKRKVAYNKTVVTHPTEVTLLASVLS